MLGSLPELSTAGWVLVLIGAFCSGMSKAGLSGISLLGVALAALAFDGPLSSGVVLPLLIFADILAASTFRQHIQWQQIRRLAVPVFLGLVVGWGVLKWLTQHQQIFRPLVGWIVLGMLALQVARQRFPGLDAKLPQSAVFAWTAGILTGVTTMVANAAGPVASVYLLILALPKHQFIHTMAWLFLLINLTKVPFMVQLGLINGSSLALNACQFPAVAAGLIAGKKLVEIIPAEFFQKLVLSLAGASAVWLIVS